MFEWTTTLVCVTVALVFYLIYRWITKNNDYFTKRGIPAEKPKFLLGNTGPLFLNTQQMIDFMRDRYSAFPNEKISGFFYFTTPTFFIRDPEIFKQIAVKDFDHFVDHKFIINPDSDVYVGNSMFLMKGAKWRDMRTTLSPAFTGSKVRHMFQFVRECTMDTCDYYLKANKPDEENTTDMLDLFARFSGDVIASCAFGLKINSLVDRDNEFYLTGLRFMDLTSVKSFVKLVLGHFIPGVLQTLGIQFLDADIHKYFSDLVLNNMAERKLKGIVRKDLIDIMIQVKEGRLKNDETETEENVNMESNKSRVWSDDALIAQCFGFFTAGFDTVTYVLLSSAYELVLNEHVQEKLANEILEYETVLNGRLLEYDDLAKLKYLNMVVSEVLRMHTPDPFLDRVCTQDYVLSDGENLNIKIEKGMTFWISTDNVHYDPRYWENPYHFNPERFSDENKHDINPAHYLPFGIGPRMCPAIRFTLMEIKCLIYHLLKSFKLQVTHKTQVPMRLLSTPLGMYPEKGSHINLIKRTDK